MNDVFGLVVFKFVIVVVIIGIFLLLDVSIFFVLIVVGGIVVGLIVVWGFGLICCKIIEWVGDELGI